MQVVSVDELVSQKILPFDLYNEDGNKIFSSGEVLTPGKLLRLRYISVLYKKADDESLKPQEPETINKIMKEAPAEPEIKATPQPETEEPQAQDQQIYGKTAPAPDINEILLKHYNMSGLKKDDPELKKVNPNEINKISQIPKKTQITIKREYVNALNAFREENFTKRDIVIFTDIRDKLIEDILPVVDNISNKSELKIVGKYDECHGLNVAILATALAYKMEMTESEVNDIALAGLLHDIGKLRIPAHILEKSNPNARENKIMSMHPLMSYKILKNELDMPENICKVALEHHERNDGSGFPYGISGNLISLQSQIISVCDVYDNLVSNRGYIEVKTPKEAIKTMLEHGTRWFLPKAFYTFVYMSNYNDMTPLDELNL